MNYYYQSRCCRAASRRAVAAAPAAAATVASRATEQSCSMNTAKYLARLDERYGTYIHTYLHTASPVCGVGRAGSPSFSLLEAMRNNNFDKDTHTQTRQDTACSLTMATAAAAAVAVSVVAERSNRTENNGTVSAELRERHRIHKMSARLPW